MFVYDYNEYLIFALSFKILKVIIFLHEIKKLFINNYECNQLW